MMSTRYRSNAWLFPFVELTLILVAALADPNTAESSQGATDYAGKLVWVSSAPTGASAKQPPVLRIEVLPAETKNYPPYALAIPKLTPQAQFSDIKELRGYLQNSLLKAGNLNMGRVEIIVMAGSAAQDLLLLHEYVRSFCKAQCSDAVIVNSGSEHATRRGR